MKRAIASIILSVFMILTVSGCKDDTSAFDKEYRYGELYLSSGMDDEFSYLLYSDHAAVTGYTGDETAAEINIPSVIDGKSVTRICESAFADDTYLEKISIPSSVTRIDDSAFFGCTSLGAVNVPSGVTVIGSSAFYGTKWYESLGEEFAVVGDGVLIKYNGDKDEITLPDNVKYLSDAFAENSRITKITVGKNVNGICNYAFYDCSSLGEINIDKSISDIGICAFEGTTWLMAHDDGPVTVGDGVMVGFIGEDETVTVPDTVKYISGAFYGNTSAVNITVPESVKNVRFASFYNSAAETIVFEGADTFLEEGVFYNCENLTSVTLPRNMTVICDDTFANCFALESVNIPSTVKNIGIASFNASGITEIVIPEGVKTILSGAFYGCVDLKKVTLPSSLVSIGEAVFSYCTSLTEINIPTTVPTVTPSLFQYDVSLKNITIPETIMRVSGDAFGNCEGLTVTVLGENTVFEEGVFSYYSESYGEEEPEPEKNTIIAKKGSAAETYAAENGLNFKELEEITEEQ